MGVTSERVGKRHATPRPTPATLKLTKRQRVSRKTLHFSREALEAFYSRTGKIWLLKDEPVFEDEPVESDT